LSLSGESPIAPEWAAFCLNEILDTETLVVAEAVTNGPVLWQYLEIDTPGSYYQSMGSSLGWALGAAVGAKLAEPSKTVICVVGDGAWMFSSPLVAYRAAEECGAPFLTVILNNQAYHATAEAILTLAPGGYAQRKSRYLACDLPAPPLYSKVASAMGLWAATVHDPGELASVLQSARNEVRQGRGALVDICISSSRPG
jgi:acetolactate synthase-1/2/3 large subunit